MTKNWHSCTFGELALLSSDRVNPSQVPDDYPYIGLEHVAENARGLVSIGSAGSIQSQKSQFNSGDILYGKLRPYFRKVFAPSFSGVCSTEIWVIRPRVGVEVGYLRGLIESQNFTDFAMSGSTGTRMPRAVWEHVSRMPVNLPPQKEQKRIAQVLYSLDDLIKVNEEIIDSLADLVDSMFVRLISNPSKPTKKVSLASTVEILSGGTPKTNRPDYWDGNIPWFSVVDTPQGNHIWVLDTTKKITKDGLDSSAAQMLPTGSTIITARGTVGNTALVGVPMTINQSCYALRSRVGKEGIFTFFSTRSAIDDLQRGAHGSVFDTITRQSLENVFIDLPPELEIEKFEITTLPLMLQIRESLQEISQLLKTRNELLPLLLSGAIEVKEVAA